MMSVGEVFAVVIFGALLPGVAMFYALYKWEMREERLRQEKRGLQPNPLELLDKALADWLLVLELPQFEDKMRRQEAARQLSTLLIEKLMLRKCPDRPSMTGLQDSQSLPVLSGQHQSKAKDRTQPRQRKQ